MIIIIIMMMKQAIQTERMMDLFERRMKNYHHDDELKTNRCYVIVLAFYTTIAHPKWEWINEWIKINEFFCFDNATYHELNYY